MKIVEKKYEKYIEKQKESETIKLSYVKIKYSGEYTEHDKPICN